MYLKKILEHNCPMNLKKMQVTRNYSKLKTSRKTKKHNVKLNHVSRFTSMTPSLHTKVQLGDNEVKMLNLCLF